jgi:hypothetical protein
MTPDRDRGERFAVWGMEEIGTLRTAHEELGLRRFLFLIIRPAGSCIVLGSVAARRSV